MIGSGIFEVEVDGRKIGFYFGTLSSAFTEQEAGKGIMAVFNDIHKNEGLQITRIIQYFYGAVKAYNKKFKVEQEATFDSVAEIIDQVGYDKIMEIFLQANAQYLPKNGKAPHPEMETGPQTEV